MSAERLPFDELFLKEKLKSEPTTWETRRQLAQGLYDKQAYIEAAEIIWTTDHIPNTDIDLAFAIRVLAKAQPRRSIRLLTAVLELNQGKAVQNMAMANALLHHGMVLQAARFYGAALEADSSLVNPDLEHFILWSDDESTMWGLFENHRPKLGELPWMVRDPREALTLTSRVSLHTTPICVPELPVVAGEHLKHELYQQEAKHNAKITPPPAVTIPIDRVDPKDRLYDQQYGASVVSSPPEDELSEETEEVTASAPPVLYATPATPVTPAVPVLPVLPVAPAASIAPAVPVLPVAPAVPIEPEITEAPPILTVAPTTPIEPAITQAPPILTVAPTSPVEPEITEAPPILTVAPTSHVEPTVAEAPPILTVAPTSPVEPTVAEAPPVLPVLPAAPVLPVTPSAPITPPPAASSFPSQVIFPDETPPTSSVPKAFAKETESVSEIAEKDTTTSSVPAPKTVEPFPATVKFPETTGLSTRITLSARSIPLDSIKLTETASTFPSKIVFPDVDEPAASAAPVIPVLTPQPAAPFFADPTPSASVPAAADTSFFADPTPSSPIQLPPIQSEKKEERAPEKESTDTIKKASIPDAFPISQSAVPTTILRVKWSTAPARPGGGPSTPPTAAPVAPPVAPPVFSAPIPFAAPAAQAPSVVPFVQPGAPTGAPTSVFTASETPTSPLTETPTSAPTGTPTPALLPSSPPPTQAPATGLRRLLFLPGRAVPPAENQSDQENS